MSSLSHRIIIHDRQQALDAVRAANDVGTPLILQTAPEGMDVHGAPYWLSIYEQIQEKAEQPLTFIADCGEYPGLTLLALRTGFTHLLFTGEDTYRTKLNDIASQSDATLVEPATNALDLHLTPHPHAICRNWLEALCEDTA